MSEAIFFVLCGVLSIGVLIGISMMSKVETAVKGNLLSGASTACAVLLTLFYYDIISSVQLWICMAIGLANGVVWAYKIKMIEMPQVVALLNGFGGIASALAATAMVADTVQYGSFELFTACLALVVGAITFTGSMVAAGKLHKLISQKPVVWPNHQLITGISLALSVLSVILVVIIPGFLPYSIIAGWIIGGFFGIAFTVRVGGADMPITISLLNSLSGVAGSIAGMAAGNPLTVAIGGIVGASGLLLTQIMCRSMNRNLVDILLGKTTVGGSLKGKNGKPAQTDTAVSSDIQPEAEEQSNAQAYDLSDIINNAKKVIIIPGYGMALAQAQHLVAQLASKIEQKGAQLDFAIHPVAGRMPGHMNVLLAEANIPYEKLREMDDINPEFADCDLAIVIGANDVINPAANTAEGTPIYGMPVIDADKAKHVIVCNFDLKPGYAGVENPLYKKKNVTLKLGDAKNTVQELIDLLK